MFKLLAQPFTTHLDDVCTSVVSETKSFIEYQTNKGQSAYASSTLRQLPNQYIVGQLVDRTREENMTVAYSFKTSKLFIQNYAPN